MSPWTVHTLGYGYTLPLTRMRVEPLLEASYAIVRETRGGLYDVASLFGRSRLWSLTAGVRVLAWGPMHRMGRYGVSASMSHGP